MGWKACSLLRKPRNGAAEAKTPTTSDPRAFLRITEPTTQVALRGLGCEPHTSLLDVTRVGVHKNHREARDTPNNALQIEFVDGNRELSEMLSGKKALLWITEDKQRKRYGHQITARKHAGPTHNPTRSALAFSHTSFC